MGKFSTLSVGISGLMAAQTGLYVTGHNMANVDTLGYTRQQPLQHDFKSVNIGMNGRGIMQTGLGTDISCIRQIRDQFLDISYRKEAGKYNFYLVKANTGAEIEAILGELQSQYSTDSVIKDLYNSLHELSIDTSSLATRGNFVSTAVTFIDKVSNVYNRLLSYQYNLNEQVKQTVVQINQLTTNIEKYNRLIMDAEMAGDHANDYRDARNVCLDQLSHLLKIEYKEAPNGRVNVLTEGKELVVNGVVQQLGLRYSGPNNSLVEPVFTTRQDILQCDEDAFELFDYSKTVSSAMGNDSGHLKGLIISRGLYLTTYIDQKVDAPANYDDIKNNFNLDCMIPKVMQQFDTLVNKLVTIINDAVAPYGAGGVPDPDAPYDLNYQQSGVEIFSRRYVSRYGDGEHDADGVPIGTYNEEDPNNYFTLYSAGNLIINPLLLEDGGYNLIALMREFEFTTDPGAPDGISENLLVLDELLAEWKSNIVDVGNGEMASIDDAYRRFTTGIGIETSEAMNYVDSQGTLLVQIDNKRQAISAVSLDEEMRNMMIFQHAYNAAARIVNVVDSMIDKVINGTGRAGL